MNVALKAFLQAALETPRLYFEPLRALSRAAKVIQVDMIRTRTGKVYRARTVDKAAVAAKKSRAK